MVYKHDKSNAREEGDGNYDVDFGDEFELKDKVDVASNDKVKGERDIDVSFASVAECSSSLRTDKSSDEVGGKYYHDICSVDDSNEFETVSFVSYNKVIDDEDFDSFIGNFSALVSLD